jgi:hypothetical protein
MFNLIHAFFLVQKLKLAPKGFTLGANVVIEKIFSICHNLCFNDELYGNELPPR